MKLIVQIPCFNEEETLPRTVADIPRAIDGIDAVEILVIDDGSTDGTLEAARRAGVHHIVRNIRNRGLARTFLVGLDASLRLGADIIVNTDGDNQYRGEDIPRLIAPILDGKAEMVVGDRRTNDIPHFSMKKKMLQRLGSFVVRRLSGTDVTDAVSGFRAFSREAALQLNILSNYSYTVETILQAGNKGLAIATVAIGTNPKTRESRLMKHLFGFVTSQMATMVRTYTMFRPLKVFTLMGGFFIFLGLIPSIRFLVNFLVSHQAGHIQSLILAAILFIIGFQLIVVGIVGDVISFNRKLVEEVLYRVRKLELDRPEREQTSPETVKASRTDEA